MNSPEEKHPVVTITGKLLYIPKTYRKVNSIVATKFKPTIRQKILFLIKELV
jgi:hypothetical protein